jgi:hypothetical protein
MLRNPHNKLATILKSLRNASGMPGGPGQHAQVRQQSLSRPAPPQARPAPPVQPQVSMQRGHYDHGTSISMSAPYSAIEEPETKYVVSSFSLSEDFDLDFGEPEIIRVGPGLASASSVSMGTDALNPRYGNGDRLKSALDTISQGPNYPAQGQGDDDLDADFDEFDEDLDEILSMAPEKPNPAQQRPASQQFSVAPVPPAKTFEQPKAHTLFDKMAQGMEYAATFDVGSVNLSNMFDQFDTAMEVQEITRTPLKRKDEAGDMAEMFSQFDRQMAVEHTPAKEAEPSEEEIQKQVVTKGPSWRPRNPKITNFEDLLDDMPASLYLLEKSSAFMNEVIAPFDTGAYSWMNLHFETYRSTDVDKAAGYCSLQVRVNGNWTSLYTEGLDLTGITLDWDRDIRMVVGMNIYARTGQDSVGNRISTLVHELGLHGLSNAAFLDRHRKAASSAEELRVSYVKRVLLEIDHLSIMGELQPLNRTYERINADVLAVLRGNRKWLEQAKVDKSIFSDHPDLVEAYKDFDHLQKPSLKQHYAPIWFQFMAAVNLERRNVYNPANSMNFLGADFKGMTREAIASLLQGSEADVRDWHAQRKNKPKPDPNTQDPSRRVIILPSKS